MKDAMIQVIIETIEKKLPNFAKMCKSDTELILMHQYAFAENYSLDEIILLGMAIKYADIHGKDVTIDASKPSADKNLN